MRPNPSTGPLRIHGARMDSGQHLSSLAGAEWQRHETKSPRGCVVPRLRKHSIYDAKAPASRAYLSHPFQAFFSLKEHPMSSPCSSEPDALSPDPKTCTNPKQQTHYGADNPKP